MRWGASTCCRGSSQHCFGACVSQRSRLSTSLDSAHGCVVYAHPRAGELPILRGKNELTLEATSTSQRPCRMLNGRIVVGLSGWLAGWLAGSQRLPEASRSSQRFPESPRSPGVPLWPPQTTPVRDCSGRGQLFPIFLRIVKFQMHPYQGLQVSKTFFLGLFQDCEITDAPLSGIAGVEVHFS
jgi:hypothetical protein